jgi:predicted PurR-regulated permease PerM
MGEIKLSNSIFSPDGVQAFRRVLEITIRLALVFLLLSWGFQILSPFVDLLAWAAIIAVALYPVSQYFETKLGGRKKTAAFAITILMIAFIIVPTVQMTVSSVDTAKEVAHQWKEGSLKIPAPTDKVKDWPLIGERTYSVWLQASQNLEATAEKFSDQLKAAGGKALAGIASTGLTILKFTFAFIIAGVFMANAEAMGSFVRTLSQRLVGADGSSYVELATATIRSVAQGVLGIAAIQAVTAAIGLVVMGIPLAGLWALGVLMLAIVQLPPWLILAPIAVYSFSIHDTTSSIIFAIYLLIVSISDAFLKPLLLGRGVEVPMLVILLGAIGGMITSGIIGLFVGAVVLALIYQLFMAWLNQQASTQTPDEEA